MNNKVNVLAVMDAAISEKPESQLAFDLIEARAAVAKLIEAAKVALGEHTAPHDCYATGPFTGDPYLDLVRCPGCQLTAALANIVPQS